MSDPTSILVIRFSSLGDVVLSTVLLDAIATAYPKARVTWATKAGYGSLLEGDSRIHDLELLPTGASVRWLVRRLRGRHFDLVLDAHSSLRSRTLTTLLAPASLRRIDKVSLDRWLRLQWRVDRPSLKRRQIDRFLDLLPEARGSFRPRLQIQAPDTTARATLAIAPGARHAPKAWPLERFAELAIEWNRSRGGRVLLLGSEVDLAAQVDRWLSREPGLDVVNRSGTRDLREVARDLAGCQRLVCNDSGLLHLAEAVRTPVVALFGPTTRDWGYFPLDPRSRVVETELGCRPCSRNGSRACALQHRLCMELLSVEEVLEATLADLSPEPRPELQP